MDILRLLVLSIFIALAGCSTTSSAPTLTPLEIQSLQTHEYEYGKDVVFPSVISVFQDLGYTIKNADLETGLIVAESAAKSDSVSKYLLGISSVSQISATAFVEEIGKMTKVRLNFVRSNKKSYLYGQGDRHDTPILDVNVYKNAFERVENAIFVRSSN